MIRLEHANSSVKRLNVCVIIMLAKLCALWFLCFDSVSSSIKSKVTFTESRLSQPQKIIAL